MVLGGHMEQIVLEKHEIGSLAEILQERKNKTDIVVPSTSLRMTGDGSLIVPMPKSDAEITAHTNNWSRNQIAGYLGIPVIYYNKLQGEHTPLLAQNVNYWFEKAQRDLRLLRIYQGEVIGFVSNAYRAIDNYDVATALLENANKVLSAQGKTMQVLRSYLTDRVFDMTIAELEPSVTYPNGEEYRVGMEVRNSEVGAASFNVKAMVIRRSCTNGLIWGDPIMQRHIGKRLQAGDIWTQKTVELQNLTTISQVEDMVTASFRADRAKKFADTLEGLKTEPISALPEYVNATQQVFQISENEKKAIWAKVKELNKFELVQAVTAYANDLFDGIGESKDKNPERATEMQELGGKLTTSKSIWDQVSDQAKREARKKEDKGTA